MHGYSEDVVNVMVRMEESTCLEVTVKFARSMVEVFGAEYLRELTVKDIERLMAIRAARDFQVCSV